MPVYIFYFLNDKLKLNITTAIRFDKSTDLILIRIPVYKKKHSLNFYKLLIKMNMKRIILLTLTILICFVSSGQYNKTGTFILGLKGGLASNINAYSQQNYKEFSFYNISNQFSITAEASVYLNNKQCIRLGAGYSENKYGVKWPESYTLDHTNVTLYNMAISLNYDYLIFGKNKIEIFASPGILTELVLDHTNRTYRDDGTSTSTTYNVYPDEKYKDVNYGFNASILFKYQLNKWMNFTMSPYYNIFFNKFVIDNSDLYMRAGGTVGLEFSF